MSQGKKDNYSWSAVDQVSDSDSFVTYLDDITEMNFAKMYKSQTYGLLEAKEGKYFLDIGCGTGDDALALAKIVAPTGKLVGLDNSERMITEAKQKADDHDLPVEFYVAEAEKLQFSDNSFDGCRCDRVFQHLPDRKQVLSEMIRVTRPGGNIVVSDPDYDSLLVDSSNKELTRRIVNFASDYVLNGWSGRQLNRFFKEFGLNDTLVFPITAIFTNYQSIDKILGFSFMTENMQKAGLLSDNERSEWLSELKQADQDGLFFSAMTIYTVSGKSI